IITAIEPVATFWPAENYHQDFYKRIRSAIRWLNGRAASFFNFSVHKATCG
ncbi:Peptide methionine sulfoxide reductase MsrA, partial [Lacticaseibacillus paracasei subsp. paracasei CNCM I-4648]